jgi:hypothetical protein
VGCTCMFSLASTIVLEPREPRRPWSIYSAVGAATPIKHIRLNLGAPGDRRDNRGQLWLAYPRPTPNPKLETSLDLKLDFATEFQPDGGFFTNDGDASEHNASEVGWIVSSGARGMKRLQMPLRAESDGPAAYTLRLIFSGAKGDKPGQRVFDVRIQGELSCPGVDVAAESRVDTGFVVREVKNVRVSENLTIELSSKHDDPTLLQVPILCGLELERSSPR